MRFEDAAFHYATEHEKEGLRNLRSEHGIEARMALMRAGLFDKLYAEELLAVGIPVSKSSAPLIEAIPHIFFSASSHRDINRALGDGTDNLKFAGREWAQVRIIKKTTSQTTFSPPKRPRGRPAVGAVLEEIVFALRRDRKLEGISRKEQEYLVREKARNRHPNLFPKQSQPSRQKILDALAKDSKKADGYDV